MPYVSTPEGIRWQDADGRTRAIGRNCDDAHARNARQTCSHPAPVPLSVVDGARVRAFVDSAMRGDLDTFGEDR